MVEVPTLPSNAFGSVDVSAGARSSGLRSTSLPASFIINTLPLPTFHFHLRWFFRECEFVLEGPSRLWMSQFFAGPCNAGSIAEAPANKKTYHIWLGSARPHHIPPHPPHPTSAEMHGER